MELNGATIWGRKTLESDVFFWKPDKWFKIWFFLVNRVNHADNKQFKRGECFTTYAEISQFTKATKGEIDHFIRWSKSCQMLATRKATRGLFVYLLNYDKYQDFNNYKSDTKSELKAKQKRNRSDTINNNDNNDKNENNNTLSSNDDLPFSFKDKLSEMFNSSDRRMPIIAYYWTIKDIKFDNKEQYSSALKRELRPAGDLRGYTNERIKEVCEWLKSNADFKWTLESVHKFIDDDLKNIERGKMSEDDIINNILKK